MRSKASSEQARLEHNLTGSKTSLRKESIRQGHVELANHHTSTGDIQVYWSQSCMPLMCSLQYNLAEVKPASKKESICQGQIELAKHQNSINNIQVRFGPACHRGVDLFALHDSSAQNNLFPKAH